LVTVDKFRWHSGTSDRTTDGAWYLIRPIGLGDAAKERDFICGLSEESRYQRLMYSVREPSTAFIEQMVHVDCRHSMAFVAVAGEGRAERIIGVARYAESGDGQGCEFAIVVSDLWQSRGVGSALTRRLIDHARSQGISHFQARISTSNSRMVAFANRLGFTTRLTPGDSTLLSADLALPPLPWARHATSSGN
jgi:acetyltransferase